jgi:hypothetical protein
MGLELKTEQVQSLISRGDFDKDKALDFYEFLVRFGLRHQAPGKWVYQVAVTKSNPIFLLEVRGVFAT